MPAHYHLVIFCQYRLVLYPTVKQTTAMSDDTDMVVEGRRRLLREWIASRYGGVQATFIEDTGVNQGELSGLLKNKSFGERRARSLEKKARMPRFYLDQQPQRKVEQAATGSQSQLLKLDPEIVRKAGHALNLRYKSAGGYNIEAHPEEFVRAYELWFGMDDAYEDPEVYNLVIRHADLSPQGASNERGSEGAPDHGAPGEGVRAGRRR